jgi:hypothetical protein
VEHISHTPVSLHELLREFPRLTDCDQQSTDIGVFVQEYLVGWYLTFEPLNTLRHKVTLPYRIESIASSLERVERKKIYTLLVTCTTCFSQILIHGVGEKHVDEYWIDCIA